MTAPWHTKVPRKATPAFSLPWSVPPLTLPRKDGYAQDYFTLRSIYFQGRPPASVNMYWRRFAVSSIPLDDPKAFEAWLMDRWREKDALLEHFYETGLFPAAPAESESQSKSKEQHDDGQASFTGYIDTSVRLARWSEVGQIFVVLATVALIANVVTKLSALFT